MLVLVIFMGFCLLWILFLGLSPRLRLGKGSCVPYRSPNAKLEGRGWRPFMELDQQFHFALRNLQISGDFGRRPPLAVQP